MSTQKKKRRLDVLLERRVAEESARLLKIEAQKTAAALKVETAKAARREKAEAEKKPRGGKRPGAGRKPDFLKRSGLPPLSAHLILSYYDVVKLWGSLLTCRSDDVRLKALAYLTDRVLGKVPEHIVSASTSAIEVSFRAVNNDAEAGKDELLFRMRKSPPELQAVEAPQESAIHFASPEPDPEPAPAPQPPLAVVNGVPRQECAKHGSYFPEGKSTMCPECIHEGERSEKLLFSLLPNSSRRN